MIRTSALLFAITLSFLPAARAVTGEAHSGGVPGEVVVTFTSPPLGGLTGAPRQAAKAAIDREQAQFEIALRASVPGARVRWRYRLVLNGIAVVVPRTAIPRLRSLPFVRAVDEGVSYGVTSTRAAGRALADAAWTAGLPNAGAGMKIGIIDDGVDQSHPYFSPAGYAMPRGFPKGQAAYTTAKVIVARAFAPAGVTYKYARRPFDPDQSEHGTHVAGIAAGNAGTPASGGSNVSGVAPQAYIGNYKALGIPTDANVGLDGNAPELVAAIEAAVADGMDVINLSIGEPEVEPTRDLVALALDGAAAAGVVPVVAAGNDFADFGTGSVSSPGTSAQAITVAATTGSGTSRQSLAEFSAAGPTPISQRLKPDVSAPGVSVLSSLPGGRWDKLSGTSMAAPRIAGAAALLLERHPTWSPAMLKAALIGSAGPVDVDGAAAPPTRGGGGLADPARADLPLVLASPALLSLGPVAPGATPAARVELADEGGGAGVWDVAVLPVTATPGATLVLPAAVTVPGVLDVSAVVDAAATEGDFSGFVRLTRGTDVRQVPFWLRVTKPALAAATTAALAVQGLHRGDTRGRPSLASRYRYPEVPPGGPVSPVLQGPEQVFRVTLKKPATNFGVVIVNRSAGARVEPRVVAAGNESRLTGYAALPLNLNPYLSQFGEPVLAAGAVRPGPGSYDVVFDSPTAEGAGSFTFRFWIDDVRPPTVTLARSRVRRGVPLVVSVADAGSGIDPSTLKVTVDGVVRPVRLQSGVLRIPTIGLRRATHRLRVQVSDYQESRNMESVPPILPNTRVLSTPVVIV